MNNNKFCLDFVKTGPNRYFFHQHSKKAKKMAKLPNYFIVGKHPQKGQNGNPDH